MKRIFVLLVMTAFLGVVIWGGVAISGSSDPKISVINKNVNGKNNVDYLDEDDMASNSDGAVVSQQSLVKYVNTKRYVMVDMSATSVYTLSTAYDNYYFDLVVTNDAPDTQINGMNGLTSNAANGVSIFMYPGTEDLNGKVVTLHNLTASGTTDLVIVPANDIFGGSGITDHIVDLTGTTYTANGATRSGYTYDVNDAQWEKISYIYRWVSASGGTWYQFDAK